MAATRCLRVSPRGVRMGAAPPLARGEGTAGRRYDGVMPPLRRRRDKRFQALARLKRILQVKAFKSVDTIRGHTTERAHPLLNPV